MSLTRSEVEHVAKLARLRLSDTELSSLEKDLNAIFGYFDQLRAVDVTNVEPLAHVLDAVNVMEDDVPHECLPREIALRDAPDRTEEYFRFPRIL